jgi:hypothetical protein
MVLVEPPVSLWNLAIGQFFFSTAENGQVWFNAMFPGMNLACLPIRPMVDASVNGGHSWEWNGNTTKPTLSPSVHAVGCWHGWVREGRMVSC